MKNKHKKSIKKVIILITISLVLLMVVNNFFEIITSTISGIENSIEAKRLDICLDYDEYEEIGEKLVSEINSLTDKHIIGAYSGGETKGIADNSQEYFVTYIPEKILKDYMSVSKDFKLNDNEVILPKYVSLDDGSIVENKEEDYIGKTINYTIYKNKYTSGDQLSIDQKSIEEKTYELIVAGVYDNAKTALSGNYLMVSNKTIVEMKFFARPEQDENGDVFVASSDTSICIYITIDKYQNSETAAESVQKVLENYKDYSLGVGIYEFYVTDEFYSLSSIKLLANIVSSFLLVCALLSLYSYIKDMMERRKQEFGIMKAIGYKTSGICKILIKEIVIEIFIPLGTALVFGAASVIAADSYFKSVYDIFEYSIMDIKLYPRILLLVSGIAVILPLLGYGWTMIKISRLKPMEALK